MNQERTLSFTVCSALLLLVIFVSSMSASESEKGDGLQNPRLASPKILSPPDMSEIRGVFRIAFSWSKVPDAAGYHIVLSRDRRFRNIAYENVRLTDSSCVVDNLGYGTYFFKISSVGSDGIEGPFSDMHTFVIAPSPPQVK